ncbi:Box C/D snoRNA protein 1 [Cercospora beticola]|uniref:Box C/D snoRNA protein 1 n=1 Tax=Cercospora beticola TaxID=122368 RepID=A0A2G5H7H7_CERBT|nr:Box C/D snoRNA protein 1 [Cercospora beticola]PIA88494.1 Box C/D snoRNA protein 1 [Cercospora beticola]WPB03235.1 hypothetical protein RHO25_007872 [Cercospora beticola]CAK1358046.1 unnamed protein product [Cercospora beticola]
MPDEALITDLCSICYENKPKYRCPRCQTKTCSLPCTQKHKQRASCNGVRNPAEYIKRSQLATPVGIDRDYNYLKSVERSIDVANRDSEVRGVDVVERAATRSIARARHPESNLSKYLDENRIEVQNAPEGMSRRKANQTRSTKRHQIMWTVEWVDAEGQKQISDSCPASSSIKELYSHKQLEDGNALKRKPGEHAKEAQKRRRKERQAESQLQQEKSDQDASTTVATEADAKVEDPSSDVHANSDSAETELAATQISQTAPNSNEEGPDHQEEGTDVSQHFYLLRTGTNAKQKVLIPLSRKATLTSCLQDRTVMEFPTIYILPYAPDSLPKEYLLEESYLKLQKSERQELRDAIAKAEKKGVFEHVSRAERAARNAPTMDANSILNVLKRDLTR